MQQTRPFQTVSKHRKKQGRHPIHKAPHTSCLGQNEVSGVVLLYHLQINPPPSLPRC